MKFEGSSVASAEGMRKAAKVILDCTEDLLSAMGNTTNDLLLAADKAMSCGLNNLSEIHEISTVKELHLRTIDELGLDQSIVSGLLDELERIFKEIASMEELTLTTRDDLVSIGECMSTGIFAAYLNKLGRKARQYGAFGNGFITTDDLIDADILELTCNAVAKRLHEDWIAEPAIPIVAGFLGKGLKSCAGGGIDLISVAIGKALGLREFQVWKDVDDVLVCDNKYLTPEEACLLIIKNEDLEVIRELESGSFGTVFHAKYRGTYDVAIKQIKKSRFTGRSSNKKKLEDGFWQEAKILSKLHHPNVLEFYGVVKDGPGGTLATVTEYMADSSLWHVLHCKKKYLNDHERLIIATDVATGMAYMHSKNIVHLDLKSGNLLMDLKDETRPICKIGDFGLSKIKINTLISGGERGTLPWMAPELLDGSIKVSEKVDVYSYSIVMWEILTGEVPYANLHLGAIMGGVLNHTLRPPVPARCDPEYRMLMEDCWARDPVQRPDFKEILLRLLVMSANAKAVAKQKCQNRNAKTLAKLKCQDRNLSGDFAVREWWCTIERKINVIYLACFLVYCGVGFHCNVVSSRDNTVEVNHSTFDILI